MTTRHAVPVLTLALFTAACAPDAPTAPEVDVPAALSRSASGTGWEVWADRATIPWDEVTFLPIFTPDETPAFVDLGTNVSHGGTEWRALQYQRDKALAVTVPLNSYLFGPLGDEWPSGTVDAVAELHAVRLVAIEIDGTRIDVEPSSILDLSGDRAVAVYNVLPRFTAPGQHTIRYFWQQKRAFYFVYPFAVLGFPDPLGMEGRRVFVAGERVGNPIDGMIVLSYDLTVE
jgi:hypothetical protein